MSTFWKVILLLAAIAVAFYVCPLLFAPLGAIVGITTVIASIIGVILFALFGIGASLLGALASVLAVVAVALSPIWLPVVIILSVIHLLRRNRRDDVVIATPVP